jgi:hypothetical protein
MIKMKLKNKRGLQLAGFSQITLLILSVLAIAFIIGFEARVVGGSEGEAYKKYLEFIGDPSKATEEGYSTFLESDGSYIGGNVGSVNKTKKVTDTPTPPTTPNPAGGVEKPEGTDKEKGGLFGSLFEQPKNLGAGLLQGITYAASAYGIIGWVGGMLGLESETTQALQLGASGGLFVWRTLEGIAAGNPESFLGRYAGMIGLGVGVAIFLMTYKKEKYKTFTFNCLPWEAPLGGSDCEKCNEGIHPCNEYRCKSLGQGCELINKGEENEMCYWNNSKIVSRPVISVWDDALTIGYKYQPISPSPPGRGTNVVKDVKTGKGCVEAFTPIEFGITTDIPSQCKISYELSSKYDEMEYYIGNSNSYKLEHKQRLTLPSPGAIQTLAESEMEERGEELAGLEINNNGQYRFHILCRSANGYTNEAPFVVELCVDEGPDTSPPIIMDFSIKNGAPVQYGVDSVPLTVYTNEPADCRWSRTDQLFEKMENEMQCARTLRQVSSNNYYACSASLTGVKDRETNDYYFRCKDQPWVKDNTKRNQMATGVKFTLVGTEPLNIKNGSVRPINGDIMEGSTTTMQVDLRVMTENGADNGVAECYYSTDNDNFIMFQNTSSHTHYQRQDLTAGLYTYFFKCIDFGGNQASANTTFFVYFDREPPEITRIFHDKNSLVIMTNEDATCYYSTDETVGCNYKIGEDSFAQPMVSPDLTNLQEHFARWETNKNHYIKCVDKKGNQPLPTRCSAIVKPIEIEE